jgi:tagatose-1,6-bisphosphate aldolase
VSRQNVPGWKSRFMPNRSSIRTLTHPPGEAGWPVVEAARRIGSLDVDVLKLEFPVDVSQEPDPEGLDESLPGSYSGHQCALGVVERGVSFEMFTRQLEIACKAGSVRVYRRACAVG